MPDRQKLRMHHHPGQIQLHHHPQNRTARIHMDRTSNLMPLFAFSKDPIGGATMQRARETRV